MPFLFIAISCLHFLVPVCGLVFNPKLVVKGTKAKLWPAIWWKRHLSPFTSDSVSLRLVWLGCAECFERLRRVF